MYFSFFRAVGVCPSETVFFQGSWNFLQTLRLKPQLQILTLRQASARDVEALSRPIVVSSTACRRDAEIGIAIFLIRSVSPLKRGPNDIAILPSRDWSI